MPDLLILSLEVAAYTIAAGLAAYAIVKLDVRPLWMGGVLAAAAWMFAGSVSRPQEPYQRQGLVTLRLRPVDEATGEGVPEISAAAIAPDDAGEDVFWRLPVAVDAADKSVVRVAVIVQEEINGSPWEQFWRAAQCVRVLDQQLMITAAGHRPWRGRLMELLPEGVDPSPVVIELRRDL